MTYAWCAIFLRTEITSNGLNEDPEILVIFSIDGTSSLSQTSSLTETFLFRYLFLLDTHNEIG